MWRLAVSSKFYVPCLEPRLFNTTLPIHSKLLLPNTKCYLLGYFCLTVYTLFEPKLQYSTLIKSNNNKEILLLLLLIIYSIVIPCFKY